MASRAIWPTWDQPNKNYEEHVYSVRIARITSFLLFKIRRIAKRSFLFFFFFLERDVSELFTVFNSCCYPESRQFDSNRNISSRPLIWNLASQEL
jgi:hypothetical protein